MGELHSMPAAHLQQKELESVYFANASVLITFGKDLSDGERDGSGGSEPTESDGAGGEFDHTLTLEERLSMMAVGDSGSESESADAAVPETSEKAASVN